MKIKVFELEFDASNLHEVAFVKDVITGSNLNVPTKEVVTAPEKEEKPIVEKETASSPTPQVTVKPKKTEAPAPAPAPAPAEALAQAGEGPTAKEMQTLVISLIKDGTLSRDDVQTIFNEFGGTSLMKIAPAKFALLKQRLTTYNS
nr:MAG TPA: activated protein kinase C receptor [Caudoviricetes sp.]